MPLLRLTSLIVATLLVAALSAFAPPSGGPAKILSNQTPDLASAAPAVVAAQASAAGSSRRQGLRLQSQYGRELARLPGQSVPGAGQ
jgi:hypothetical protein